MSLNQLENKTVEFNFNKNTDTNNRVDEINN